MKRIFSRSLLFVSTGVLVLSMFANILLSTGSASAAIENPANKIEDLTKRWMYYRGMWACLESGLYDQTLSRDDVMDGHWDPINTKEGFGYFAPDMDDGNDNDGTVDCNDGSIWVRGATLFGFENAVELLCEINRTIDDNDSIDPNGDPCNTSTKFEVDNRGNWPSALTSALDKNHLRPKFHIQDNAENGSMYYLIGAHSLEIFCGSGVPLAEGISDLTNDENRVSVDLVDTETGAVEKSKTYFLEGNRDQDSNVDDVYYNQGGNSNEAIDKKCWEMAEITRDRSDDYSNYLIRAYNEAVATAFKAAFEVTSEMKKKICGNPPTGTGEIPGPAEKKYAACVTGIVTRFNSAVDTCKNGATLFPVAMTLNERSEKMKQCLKKALPAAYDKAIDGLESPNVDDNDSGNTTTPENGTSCAIAGIGWIVCPVMTFLAKLNDSAFAFLKSMLEIRPALITDSATQNAWAAFRDIANVAFVIAFMVIVYSQLTSVGISNYGVKRMLPRLFIAAILVNVSYWVCAAMVDISNIVGSSIYSLLGTSIDVGGTPGGGGGETWSDIMAVVLAVAAGILLVVVIVLAPTVLLALAVILLILVARQALVIMLIVLSPLAFVAYLLPNTEDWFKRWWKMLVATLMVFPLIGMVFGASTLASTILMNVAAGGSGDDEQLLKIVALAVMAIPLFAVPSLLIGAMSAAGSIGNKLSSLSNRANRSAMNRGKARFDKTALGQYRKYRGTERDKRRAMIQAGAYSGSNKNPLNWGRNAASQVSGAVAGSKYSGKFGDRIVASGFALADKEWDEEVGRQKTSMTSMDHAELLKIMKDKSATAERRAAAAGTIMGRDFREGHLQALEAAGQLGRTDDKDVGGIQKQMAHDMKDKPFALGDQAAGQLGIGTYGKPQPPRPDGSTPPQLGDIDTELADRVGAKLSGANLAGMNPDELKRMHAMAQNRNKTPEELAQLRREGKTATALSDEQLSNFQGAILEARGNEQYRSNIKPEAAEIHEKILGMGVTGTPPATPPGGTGPGGSP